jgi:hypothetical protein
VTFDRFVTGKQVGVPPAHGVQRMRFEQTYRAVVQNMPVDIDAIIPLDPNLSELQLLQMELSQITYSINQTGKIVINKQPPGTLSPNWADACMFAFNPQSRASDVWARGVVRANVENNSKVAAGYRTFWDKQNAKLAASMPLRR